MEEANSEVRGTVYPRVVSDSAVRDRVLVAVKCTLESGRVSADCVDKKVDNLLVTAPEEETEKLLVIAEFLLASVTTLAVEPFLCAALDSLNQLGYTVTPDATGKLILLIFVKSLKFDAVVVK